MKTKRLAFECAAILAITASSFALAQYYPPASTGPTTNPVTPAQGGTGSAVAPTNGQIPIGNTATGKYAPANIIQGAGVTVTNGANSITIAATGSGGTVTTSGTPLNTQVPVFTSASNIAGNINFTFGSGTLTLGNPSGSTGQLAINGGSGYTLLNSASIGSNVSITLPGQNITFPASNAAGVLTNDGAGNCTWTAAGIGGSIANTQVAYGSGTNIAGTAGFIYNGTGVATLGDGSTNEGVIILKAQSSSFPGEARLQNVNGGVLYFDPGVNNTGAIYFIGPEVAVTEITAQPGSNGAMVLQSTAGVRTAVNMSGDGTLASNGAMTLKNTGPGVTSATNSSVTIDAQGRVTALSSGAGGGGMAFGGNGADGAVTSFTKMQTNATTVTVTAAQTVAGQNCPGIPIIQSSGVQNYNNGAALSFDSNGYSGGAASSATKPATNGQGASPGYASVGATATNGGGGGGFISGGFSGSGGDGGGLAGAVLLARGGGDYSFSYGGAPISAGSGGGGGGGISTNANSGTGGSGGGSGRFLSAGAFTIASGGKITAKGGAGSAATGNPGAGGGGGAGGWLDINSLVSITIAASGGIDVSGGAGGAGNSTAGGGGGGGTAGIVHLEAPTVTGAANIVGTGGAAGTTSAGGTAATAGNAGGAFVDIGTPTLPLISLRDKKGWGPLIQWVKKHPEVMDGNVAYITHHDEVIAYARGMDEYIACMGRGNAPEAETPQGETTIKARREDIA